MAPPIIPGVTITKRVFEPERHDTAQSPVYRPQPETPVEPPEEHEPIYEPPGHGKDRPGYAEWVAGGKVKRP
jgi:hypothetical protein